MRGATAERKPPAVQNGSGSGAAELRRHADLMRAMDSPDGAWNPEPDGHIAGALREDVNFTPNESKLLALVKQCCVRLKTEGRTAWGVLDGKPLTAPRVKDYFGWDANNAQKHARRLLAWGFLRRNEDGVFGLGARTDGVFAEGRIEGEDENDWVCTYPIPEYLAVAAQGLSDSDRENFIQGWVTRKQAHARRLADLKRQAWEEEQTDLAAHCRTFGMELKRRKPKPAAEPEPAAPEEPPIGSVHTQSNGSGHTQKLTLYTAANGYGQTAPNKEVRVQSSELANSPGETTESKPTAPPPEDVLTVEIEERIARSRLTELDGKPIDPRTVQNIRLQLARLEPPGVKEVLEIVEEKCRFLYRHPNEARGKTWGWVYAVVKGEVNNRAPGAEEIGAQMRALVARKGMP